MSLASLSDGEKGFHLSGRQIDDLIHILRSFVQLLQTVLERRCFFLGSPSNLLSQSKAVGVAPANLFHELLSHLSFHQVACHLDHAVAVRETGDPVKQSSASRIVDNLCVDQGLVDLSVLRLVKARGLSPQTATAPCLRCAGQWSHLLQLTAFQ